MYIPTISSLSIVFGLHCVPNKLKGLKVAKEDQRSISSMVDGQQAHIRYHMQLNKSFLAIGNGITDICDSRVAFATEKIIGTIRSDFLMS